jgi:hypothetical protein
MVCGERLAFSRDSGFHPNSAATRCSCSGTDPFGSSYKSDD